MNPICQVQVHCDWCRRIENGAWRKQTFGGDDCPRQIPLGGACEPKPTDWCGRFGLPMGLSGCAVCARAEGDERVWLLTQLRALGLAYQKLICPLRVDRGEREERRCCGGQVRLVPVFVCARTGQRATCADCRDKPC